MTKIKFLLTAFACCFATGVYAAPLFSPAFPSNADALLIPSQKAQLAKVLGDPGVKSYQFVKMNLKTLDQASVDINPTQADVLPATNYMTVKRSQTNYSWFAKTSEGSTILSVNGDAVEGIIHQGPNVYRVQSLGKDLQVITEIDQSKFPERYDRPDTVQPDKALNQKLVSSPSTSLDVLPASSKDTKPATAQDSVPIVDATLVYTPEVEARYTDKAALMAHLQLMIDDANQHYANSVINAQMRLVDVIRVDYVGTTDLGQSLNDLRGTTDGSLDDIHARVSKTGTDITVLITSKVGSNLCGIAYVGVKNTAYAFGVVDDGCSISNHTFAHETGHIYGAGHDIANNSAAGVAHGLLVPGNWRTVMAYACTSGVCPKIPYYSNPDITHSATIDGVKKDIPIGTVAQENNAKILNDNAATLAGLRAHKNWNCFNTPNINQPYFLIQGTTLCPLDTMTSPNGQYKLTVQENGNLVIKNSSNVQIWTSNTTPIDPLVPKTEIRAVLEPTGNFAIYDRSDATKWAAGTSVTTPLLLLQDDGNLAVYSVLVPFSAGFSDPSAGTSATGPYVIAPGQTLTSGQSGTSGNGKFKITMQAGGNLVVTRVSNSAVIFSSGTSGAGNRAVMQQDGNFVVYSPKNVPLWNTKTAGKKGAYALLQDDGNFVVYSLTPKWSWKTGTIN
ncbi:M12 family metallo-peptidase [Aquirhabdus parva]|uniref:Bulb-type lectin domain-containing protein n=1 Tax=Aquirhabdus parva TaxID=2283318 RepID=A0A345P5G6_9GAMM|nr:M12 family metallo-peptidase [Aquirhabdus parva]AXI02525.1 hypothetical protein HYN46_06600 [Aquirhabdus parva]